MSEISEMMPLVTALLKSGQMPSADQIRRMLVIIDKQDAAIDRLRATLTDATRPSVSGDEEWPVLYMDWYFNTRVSALEG